MTDRPPLNKYTYTVPEPEPPPPPPPCQGHEWFQLLAWTAGYSGGSYTVLAHNSSYPFGFIVMCKFCKETDILTIEAPTDD